MVALRQIYETVKLLFRAVVPGHRIRDRGWWKGGVVTRDRGWWRGGVVTRDRGWWRSGVVTRDRGWWRGGVVTLLHCSKAHVILHSLLPTLLNVKRHLTLGTSS